MDEVRLPARERYALLLQLAVSRLLSPLWIPLTSAIMRFGFDWRVDAVERAAARAEYRRLRRESEAPILICANHLTMFDSFVIGWEIGYDRDYLVDFGALPWNTPERVHFASNWWKRALAYLYTADGHFVNLLLVRRGYAQPLTIPPNDRFAGRFVRAARHARARGAGLWAQGACV